MSFGFKHIGLQSLIRWLTPRVLPVGGGGKLARMRRMFQGLAVMTALGLVAVLAPYVAGDQAGMIIGGLLAAPMGAVLVKRIPSKRLLALVGVLLIATSLFSLYKSIF